jgi:hypothetical protein
MLLVNTSLLITQLNIIEPEIGNMDSGRPHVWNLAWQINEFDLLIANTLHKGRHFS